MLKEIENLLVLQDRDQKIRTLDAELKLSPQERKEVETRLSTAQAQFEQIRHETQAIEIERKKLELDADTKRAAIARYKTQQMQTRKNEEFQALAGEIGRFEKDIGTIEDEEISLMERAEAAKQLVAAASNDLNTAKHLAANRLRDLDAKTAALESRLSELRSTRESLVATLDEDLCIRYERLLKSKGDSAVVALEHDVCTGCHMKVTTQTAVKARGAKEIVCCEQCGRILYEGET